jgi:hypothetical protein
MNERLNEGLRRVDDLKILVGAPVTGRAFEDKDIWTDVVDQPVPYTCPGKQVLAGINFVWRLSNSVRTPVRIEYICKTLGP